MESTTRGEIVVRRRLTPIDGMVIQCRVYLQCTTIWNTMATKGGNDNTMESIKKRI